MPDTDEETFLSGGDVLPNGALVLAYRKTSPALAVVLCEHMGEYVTWRMRHCDPNTTHSGNYFPIGDDPADALIEAVKDFAHR